MMPRRQRKPSLKVREMQQAETDTQVPYLSTTEAKRRSVVAGSRSAKSRAPLRGRARVG